MILKDSEKVLLSATPVSSAGNPAALDGVLSWESSDPGIIVLEVGKDGLVCTATTVGPLGVAQVTARGDADLGDGVREVIGVLDIEVLPGEAVSLNLGAGVPEPK